MTTPYLADPDGGSEPMLDARAELLDRQVLDVDGVPVAVVDDLELSEIARDGSSLAGHDPPVIVSLLSGPSLGVRIFGGRLPTSRLARIPWTLVADLGVVVSLAVRGETLDVTWPERWVRDHIIRGIPGGRHDPD